LLTSLVVVVVPRQDGTVFAEEGDSSEPLLLICVHVWLHVCIWGRLDGAFLYGYCQLGRKT